MRKKFSTDSGNRLLPGKRLSPRIVTALLPFFIFAIPAQAQNFSVPGLTFEEFGTDVTENDRATAAYYMGLIKAGERLIKYSGEDSDHKYNVIKQEIGDSLLTLDNYGLCEAMCNIQENDGGAYMRSWDTRDGNSETPALQRLYAYGIQNALDSTYFIRSLLCYAERASYEDERTVGEYLLRECSEHLSKKQKYDTLGYAVAGIFETVEVSDTTAVRTAYGYCVDQLALSLTLFGEDDRQYLNNLAFCAWFGHSPHIDDWDMTEKLYDFYRRKPDWIYMDGAYNVLDILLTAANVDLSGNSSGFGNPGILLYSEAQIYLLYSKAQLDYVTGKNGYAEEMRLAYEAGLKYLSPSGGHYDIKEYILPDYRLLTGLINWMKVSYDSSDAGDVYDEALFLKGMSENLAPAILKRLKETGEKDLCEYADSLRNNFDRRTPWRTGSNPFTDIDEEAFRRWSARESEFEPRLNSIFGSDGATKLWDENVVDWISVRNALGDDETAVEIVNSFPLPGGEMEYKALILNREDAEPMMVRLCSATELRTILKSVSCSGASSRKLFETLWKPPTIIHIAAHGFYHSHRPAARTEDEEKDNPLDRCGILLETGSAESGMSGMTDENAKNENE